MFQVLLIVPGGKASRVIGPTNVVIENRKRDLHSGSDWQQTNDTESEGTEGRDVKGQGKRNDVASACKGGPWEMIDAKNGSNLGIDR